MLVIETVSANYASVLSLGTALGRWFLPEDDRPSAAPVAVISHRFWRTRLGSNPDVIGRHITVNDRLFQIVGVAPAGFQGALPPLIADAWITAASILPSCAPESRKACPSMNLIARLLPDTALETAIAEMRLLDARLRPVDRSHPASPDLVQVRFAAGYLWDGGNQALLPVLSLLAITCGMVLLIASLNVANLLLSRAVVRRREIAIRRSLGAGHLRLFQETFVESLLLTAGAVALGVLAGHWAGRVLEATLPADPASAYRGIQFFINWRVAMLVGIAGIGAAVLFSLLPAIGNARLDLHAVLMGSDSGSRAWQREFYSMAQIALSLTLLVAGGLSLRALHRLQSVDVGFAKGDRLTLRLAPSSKLGAEEMRHLLDDLTRRARAIPGVLDATLSSAVFGTASAGCVSPSPAAEPLSAGRGVVDPNYFDFLRVPIVQGEGFRGGAARTDVPGVVVNESMARKLWPGEHAPGKLLWFGCSSSRRTAGYVAGVARDMKYENLHETGVPFFYLSRMEIEDGGSFTLLIRTSGEPDHWAKPLLQVAQSLGGLQVHPPQSLQDLVGLSLLQARWQAALLGIVGLLASGLAAIGLYGVVAYSVAQRTREIALRLALGARPGDVLFLVLARGLWIAGWGGVAGFCLSAGTMRLMRAYVYGVNPLDPPTLAAAALALAGVALVATWVPARRATRMNPVSALRCD